MEKIGKNALVYHKPCKIISFAFCLYAIYLTGGRDKFSQIGIFFYGFIVKQLPSLDRYHKPCEIISFAYDF